MPQLAERPAPAPLATPARPAFETLVARAEAILPDVRARAQRTEEDRRVSAEITARFREADIFRLMQPARFGGYEYGFSEFIEMNRVTGRACASTSWCVSLGMVHQWFIGLFPLEAQEEVWRDDRDAIAAVSYAPAGKARAVPGGWMISGKWSWLSNVDNSRWYMLGTLFPPEQEGGKPVAGFALVPATCARIVDDWHAVGLKGTGSKSIEIADEVFLPQHRRLTFAQASSSAAPGTSVNTNPLYRIPFLACVPLCLTTPALGAAEGALHDFVEWASGRTTRGAIAGSGNAVAQFAQVQGRVGEAAACVDAAYLVVTRDTRDVEGKVARGEPVDIPTRVRNRRGHAYCAKMSAQAATLLFEATGGAGLMLDAPIQRAWRDTHAIARHISLNWDGVGSMYGQHLLGVELRGQY
jgi:alkylation response protein AidB-like acyl-CoA dehydrogenase